MHIQRMEGKLIPFDSCTCIKSCFTHMFNGLNAQLSCGARDIKFDHALTICVSARLSLHFLHMYHKCSPIY